VRRIGRYILNGLTVLSLVLCVGTVGLWVRSYWKYDQLNYEWMTPIAISRWKMTNIVMVASGRGEIALSRVIWNRIVEDHAPRWELYHDRVPDPPLGLELLSITTPRYAGRRMGVTWLWEPMELPPPSDGAPGDAAFHEVVVPHAYPAAMFTAMPLWWLCARLRKPCKRRGVCEHCNYDLRATPDRCPECGMIPTKVKA
jgi:hypothetical protein